MVCIKILLIPPMLPTPLAFTVIINMAVQGRIHWQFGAKWTTILDTFHLLCMI